MYNDSVLILFISVFTALLGEGLTWLMVYRTEKYQKLKAEVERQSKRLEKKKEAHGDTVDRQQKKKIEREEEKLKNNNRDLSLVKMKSMFAIGFAFTALLSMFNSIGGGCEKNVKKELSMEGKWDGPQWQEPHFATVAFPIWAKLNKHDAYFDGRVVAKLPFIPIGWIQGLSHRNLLGEDFSDCSFIFLYILCTMSIRQNIQKLLGFAPSRTASKQGGNIFAPASQPIK